MRTIGMILIGAVLSGCATTGSTLGSGVGDRQLEHPPYYAGATTAGVASLGRYPVTFQRGASQAAAFDPAGGAGTPIDKLLGDIDALVDSVLGRPLPLLTGAGMIPPNVYFGCDRGGSDDCPERGDSVLGRRGTTMRLAVERPSAAWTSRTASLLDSIDAGHVLLITLEVGQYWPRQRGLTGSKRVELGTGYVVPLPWLTSLETPVTVLQLTGAVIDRGGKAVRIGAEGLVAQRSPLMASALGAQRLLTDDDVHRARTARRDDLPGQPLVWREAACQLLRQLAQRQCP